MVSLSDVSTPETLAALQQENAALQQQVKQLQAHHRLVLDSALDYAVITTDISGCITEWSAGAEAVLGWAREEMLGQPLHRLFTAEEQALGGPERVIGQAVTQGRSREDGWRLRASGERFWASGITMPMWQGRQLVGIVKILRDLTEQIEAERARERRAQLLEKQFQQLAESIPQLVWITDAKDSPLYFNPRWLEFTGADQATLHDHEWLSLILPDARERVRQHRAEAIASASHWEDTFQMRDRDGSYRWFLCRALPIRDDDGQIIRWFSSCTDVDVMHLVSSAHEQHAVDLRETSRGQVQALSQRTSQLKTAQKGQAAAEDQVRQLQKMEAVGQLTGGIAHDFNNMLTVIMGGLNMLQIKLARGDTRVEHYFDLAMEGTHRAAQLTQRLLAFARQQALSPEPVDMNRLVTSLSDMLKRALGSAYRIEFVRHAGLWHTFVDVGSLEQVILNLCVNARDAMEQGGKITVETGNVFMDDHYAQRENVAGGEYVMIAITDTGTGIDRETLDRVFEPYFTTKGVGHGTGLGLSQVYGFVKQSQGHVKLYSEVGHGTSVKVYLPRFYGVVEPVVKVELPDEVLPKAKANECVLVVEDDPRVRVISTEALMELGYQVLDTDNGPAALQLLAEHPEISLIFTDVVMPEMTGRQLADQVALTQPDLPILYTTGYTRNAIAHNGTLDRGVALLPKPFTLRDLAIKVRQVLDN